MSAPGSELFPDTAPSQYNSYTDVNMDQVVEDPLNISGVRNDVADQPQSDKEFNFKALRDETSKLKQESEYWRGQAEAYSRSNSSNQSNETEQADAYSALDWDDSRDVRKAFESLKGENDSLRYELKDAITAINTKSTRQDWNNMVTQHVPELTSKNPMFAEMIQKASNPYEAAYLLAELNAKGNNTSLSNQQPMHGERAMNNAGKPQSLSSVAGNGTLSSADYYASMSDADFMKIAGKNMANI